jgi:type I restriction enzyme S subunit
LEEVCKYDKQKNIKDNLPYVGLENIKAHTGEFVGSLKPLEVKSSTFYFTNKHLLYGRLRPYLNKVLCPNFEGHCSTEIFPIKANSEILRKLLFYWFILPTTVKKIDATWTGARMPRANMNEVINFRISIPKIETQKQIIIQLDQLQTEIKKLEIIYQEKINNLIELKKSILQKAFKGELQL